MAAEISEQAWEVVGPAEVARVRRYLSRVALVLFDEEETQILDAALLKAEPHLKVFIEDPQEHVLSITKSLPPEEVVGETGSSDTLSFHPTYTILLRAEYWSSRCIGVIFIKRGAMIHVEADKSIQSQLWLLQVNEDSLYETLNAYVQDAITPLFNSYIHHKCRDGRLMH